MRKIKFSNNEFYHIFNRGVEKRNIFNNKKDLERFLKSMKAFNSVLPIGSLYEQSFQKDKIKNPLVNFIAFSLLPNHFHFILEQVYEGGISEFMKRLMGGYTWYFNQKNKRSGVLFQGRFKANHIDSNEYLLHSSVYVNLNHKQKLGGWTAKSRELIKSSWEEYLDKTKESFCDKDIVLNQFNNPEEYKEFALSSLEDIKFNKERYKDLER
jgi:REP element-mobilizing transposase RayT